MPGNGGAALDVLGLSDRSTCVRIRERRAFWAHGRPIVTVPVAKAWGDEQPCFGFHRQDLHNLLKSGLDDLDLRLGVTFERIEEVGDAVEVRLTDGTEMVVDVVVGADGIRSYGYFERRDEVDTSAEGATWLAPFRDYAEPIAETLRGVAEDEVHFSPTEELAPLPCWGRGREKKSRMPYLAQRLALPFIGAKALTADYAPLRARV